MRQGNGPAEISRHMQAVAEALLGSPNRAHSKPDQLRYGTNGSLAVNLRDGVFYDHESAEGGGVLDLIARETGLNASGAIEWMRDQLSIEIENADKLSQIVATYDYIDEGGETLFQVVRLSPKTFRQRRPNPAKDDGWEWSVKGVRQVPYQLPDLLEAISTDRPVFIVEGEKDVGRLAALGLVATCNAGGAGKWSDKLAASFDNAHVVILPDNDQPGSAHAVRVAESLRQVAESIRVVELPDLPAKGDVSDWLRQGGTVEALNTLIDQTPDWRDRPPPMPDGFLAFADIGLASSTEWMVRNLVPASGMSVMFGEPGCGKSFLALDLSLHVATGTPWFGAPVAAGGVVYVAAEGQGGFRKRVIAFRNAHDAPAETPFALLPETIDLRDDKADASRIIAAAVGLSGRWRTPIKLIVIDTLARVLGGGDENVAGDMGALIRNIDCIEKETGAHVLVVHHKPKDGQRTPRGHSSLMGAADAAFEIEAYDGGLKALTVAKQKDGEAEGKLAFSLSQVILGTDEDGAEISTCIVSAEDAPLGESRHAWQPTGATAIALKALDEAIATAGQPSPGGHVPNRVQVVPLSVWREYAYAMGIAETDTSEANRKAFKRAREKLLEQGFIGQWQALIWRTGHV